MATESVPRLTATQTRTLAKIVAAHRPKALVEFNVSPGKVDIVATSRRGVICGMWRLELAGSDMLLRVVIGDNMYIERIPEEFPDRFDRIAAGLDLWVKAANAEELKAVLSDTPTLGHLNPEHTINPIEYSPIGSRPLW